MRIVRQIMKGEVVKVLETASAMEAAKKIATDSVGTVAVDKNHKLVGTVTD